MVMTTPCIPALWREAADVLGPVEGRKTRIVAAEVERLGSYTSVHGVRFVRVPDTWTPPAGS